MTALDTVLLGITLLAVSLAASGSYAYRSRSQNPYWLWAWAMLLLAGAAGEAAKTQALLTVAPPLLSPVFSAFLLAGALFVHRKNKRRIR